MKCNGCGYDHEKQIKHWEFRGESEQGSLNYIILSNIFDGEILKEILDHATSLLDPPFYIYLDTCSVETHGCSTCFNEYLKMEEDRRRIEQLYLDKGITLNQFF